MDDIIKIITEKIPDNFSGIITLDIENKSVISEARGLRDINNNLKNSIDTKFAIASGTKFFTALGIGKLIDSGKLTLDSKVWDILEDSPSYIGTTATIKDLLSHTSGMYDYLDEETMDDDDFEVDIPWYKLINPTDYLPLFNGKKPKFNPGEKSSYSNGGYVLLGVIIEKVTGLLFRDFITENILTPCDMKDSGYFFFHDLPKNTAIGYKNENDKLVANYYSIPIVGGGDGGIYTTAGDLAKLWLNFVQNRILSFELTKTFITPISKVSDSDYGLGLYLSGNEDDRDLYLYGCDPGVGFHSRYNIKTSRLINIISNKTWGLDELNDAFWKSDL